MQITEKALSLTKKFAAGAPCPVNFRCIENTMFWPWYEAITRKKGFAKVTTDIVKEYWFKIHNDIVLERFRAGNLNLLQAKNCMVRTGMKRKSLFCFHGGKPVCSITEKEAEIIAEHTPELTEDP
jgi:hypothetical protein